jgi:hypothetical protein
MTPLIETLLSGQNVFGTNLNRKISFKGRGINCYIGNRDAHRGRIVEGGEEYKIIITP